MVISIYIWRAVSKWYHILKLVVSININFKYCAFPKTGIPLEYTAETRQLTKMLFTSKSYVENSVVSAESLRKFGFTHSLGTKKTFLQILSDKSLSLATNEC